MSPEERDAELISSLADHLPVGIWVARAPSGEFVYTNPRFAEIMGTDGREDVSVGEWAEPYGIFDREGEPLPAERMPFVQALVAQDTITEDDIVIHRPDGQRIFVRAHARPIFTEGAVSHIVVAFTDISAEVLAGDERDLLARERRFVLENMDDFVYRHDAAGQFHYISPAVERITGYTVTEWLGHYTQFLPESPVNAKVVDSTERALATGEAQPPYQVEVRHKGGDIITLEVRERPFFVGGQVAGLIGVAHDITARVQAQAAARSLTEALHHKNRELENIIHVASHDLRSPLVGIEGFSSELGDLWTETRSRLPPDDPAGAEISFMIEHIRRGAERMDRRLNGLLELSRLGRVDLDITPVDMDALLSNIRDELAYQLREAPATLEVGPLPNCPGDRFRLGQVFTNLVDNAIKYLRPGVAGLIRVEGERRRDWICYRVSDNGLGIQPAFRARIFEIFHRLDPRRCQGEGLGLTIAQRIVLLHDGRIEVSEGVLGGTCFEVHLPAEALRER